MNIADTSKIQQIHKLCPRQCSIAFCLNQLRTAHIQFLNLGNLIICPNQQCLMVFKSKQLFRIEVLHDVLQS